MKTDLRTLFTPVEQTSLYDGSETRGNCVAACVASIFGTSIQTVEAQGLVPGCGFQDVARWTSERRPALEYREQDFCTNFRVVEGDGRGYPEDRWEYDLPAEDHRVDPPTCGLWIAHVVSPRGVLGSGPYRGMPVQHAVVMRGATLLWDPHPQRDMGVGQTVGLGWWIAREPGMTFARDPDWVPRELTGLSECEQDEAA